MERYTKGKHGEPINYRYTKETESEYFTRILETYIRDNNFLTEIEIDKKIEDAIVNMGFSRLEEKRKSQVTHLLLIRRFAIIVVPLIIALQLKSSFFEWGDIKDQIRQNTAVREQYMKQMKSDKEQNAQ